LKVHTMYVVNKKISHHLQLVIRNDEELKKLFKST
jgi:hypothetical protein